MGTANENKAIFGATVFLAIIIGGVPLFKAVTRALENDQAPESDNTAVVYEEDTAVLRTVPVAITTAQPSTPQSTASSSDTTVQFNTYSETHMRAAQSQAAELGITDRAFIQALTAVNAVQGVEWYKIHRNTWNHLRNGNFDGAIVEVQDSGWYRNSASGRAEVEAFQAAIRTYADNLNQPNVENNDNGQGENEQNDVPEPRIETAAETFERFVTHILNREGFELTVYNDNGQLAVGAGHQVTPEDNLKLGDTITAERARAFLQVDATERMEAAREQLAELGIQNNPDFLIALAGVNYQLGTGWRSEHPRTWRLMTEGRFDEAAVEVGLSDRRDPETGERLPSRWSQQSPIRVQDFQSALRTLDDKLEAQQRQQQNRNNAPRPPAPPSS